jgi:peptide/nickel transport system permease protein
VVSYLIRRVLQAILVTALVTLFSFLLVRLFPGGPVRALLGQRASSSQLAYYNRVYGFNQPFYIQFGKWVWQLLQGNLGYSVKLNQTVASLLAQTLPKTVLLVALGLLVSLVFGIPLGVYQAARRNSLGDHVLSGVAFLGYAAPTYLIALYLVAWLAVDTHVFPVFAPQTNSISGVLADPRALVLPVFSYAFGLYASWSQFMRSSVLENLVQDYVRTARAKGASEGQVLWGHVFRNSMITIVTLIGLSVPTLVSGALFIEVIFNYPGAGLAFYQAALNDDVVTLMGFTIVATIATIVGNLLADIGYAMLDPRVRYS